MLTPAVQQSTASSSAAGYVDANSATDLIDLHVLCFNGEGCMVTLRGSSLGLEAHLAISKQLPPKEGAKIILYHVDSRVMLHQTLNDQGIIGKAATLSCTYVPTNLCAAWRCIMELPGPEADLSLEGITRVEGIEKRHSLQHQFPKTLTHMALSNSFNEKLEQVTLPSSLQTLTFGECFNQSLELVTLPNSLQTLTFGYRFDQSLEQVTLPNSL